MLIKASDHTTRDIKVTESNKHSSFKLALIAPFLVFGALSMLSAQALAQTESEGNDKELAAAVDENGKTEDDRNIERIEVTGKFNDLAMRAFNNGDFEIAELEFSKNARCARIAESNERAAIEGLVNNAVRGELRGQDTGRAIDSNFGDTVAPSVTQGSNTGVKTAPEGQIQKRTCSNRGFQLYMQGMSQIQLGRTEEAEENLQSAVFLNKNLYDAHHRLALMKLLRNDTDGAEDEFEAMKRILNRCRKCDVRDEIVARVDFIEKALSGEIKLR